MTKEDFKKEVQEAFPDRGYDDESLGEIISDLSIEELKIVMK